VVGTIGRLHEQKGHTYLIEAAARVIREHGPVQFVLVGDGPLKDRLHTQVEQLGIAEHFYFAGFQSEYVPYMQAMDIGVMPSLWEGFSISMQEFMALGKPMVITNHGSFLEAFTHGQNGLVVPTRDGPALAAAVLQLLRDADLARRLGQAASERVRAQFSIQHHMQDLMKLYDSLLCSSEGRS
jgi:glycosyltransferase involved in cell wall biosynthesis